jgi:hypothetical protein
MFGADPVALTRAMKLIERKAIRNLTLQGAS